MEKYIIVLALAYFKEANGRYTINELSEILGHTHKRIEELIFYLHSKEYIEYVDNLLHITKKGLTLLIANDMGNISFSNEELELIHIRPESAVPIDKPYVPKDFSKKYDG